MISALVGVRWVYFGRKLREIPDWKANIICSVEHRKFEVGYQHGGHEGVGALKWDTNMADMTSRENVLYIA